MPVDLQSLQTAVAIGVGLLAIVGTVFGWFGKLLRWVRSLVGSERSAGLMLDVHIEIKVQLDDNGKLRSRGEGPRHSR